MLQGMLFKFPYCLLQLRTNISTRKENSKRSSAFKKYEKYISRAILSILRKMHQAVCPNVLIATTLDPQQVFLNDILSIWHKTSLAIFLQNLQFITTLDNKRSYKKQILQNILGFRKI